MNKHIVAIGGGGFGRSLGNLKIENYLYKKGFTTMIKAWPDVVWRKKGKRK